MSIADALEDGRFIVVFDECGHPVFSLLKGSHDDDGLKCFTKRAVTVKDGNYLVTYNEKGVATDRCVLPH
jgi:hypothetical protein